MNEKYDNSYKYYENRECQYYPCHKGDDHINCLFCYCPLYSRQACPGNYELINKGSKVIKNCMNCRFPHEAENYEIIMNILKEH